MRIPVPYGPQLSLLSGLFQGGAQAQARGQEMAMRERALAAQVAEAAARQRLAERSQAHSEQAQREGMEFEKFRFGEGHRQRLAESGQAQGFQAGEAEKGRGFQRGESALERALRLKMHGETLGVQERGLGIQESEAKRAGARDTEESEYRKRAEQREIERRMRELDKEEYERGLAALEDERKSRRESETERQAGEARIEERRRFELGRGAAERQEVGRERGESRSARERAYGAALQSLQAVMMLAQEIQAMSPGMSIEQARIMAESVLERSAAGLGAQFEGR